MLRLLVKEKIARRYFLMNSFDGALTILGIITAIHLSGIHEPKIVVASSLGAASALAVSGVWSAYATERAERLRELKDLEFHLMRKLHKTRIAASMREKVFMVALINGLSPITAALVIVSPYFVANVGLVSYAAAFHTSLIIVAVVLSTLGALIGLIAREKIFSNALKMLAAGICVAILTILLEKTKVI